MDFSKQVLDLYNANEPEKFLQLALAIYEYQSKSNKVYNQYLQLIGRENVQPTSLDQIPLMPISFFKYHDIKSGNWTAQTLFKSSGTTQYAHRSTHHVHSIDFYNDVIKRGFDKIIEPDTEIFALLPSYMENGESSLVAMMQHLIQDDTRFYLYSHEDLFNIIQSQLAKPNTKVLLLGVSFALFDFAQTYSIDSDRLTLMFTGGMKNRKAEMTQELFINHLKEAFPKSPIMSEFGMTEMFSQFYAQDGILFQPSASTFPIIKDMNDPFQSAPEDRVGQLGIIDLANFKTISFIQTEDLAIKKSNGFLHWGRMDQSDLRGCALLYNP